MGKIGLVGGFTSRSSVEVRLASIDQHSSNCRRLSGRSKSGAAARRLPNLRVLESRFTLRQQRGISADPRKEPSPRKRQTDRVLRRVLCDGLHVDTFRRLQAEFSEPRRARRRRLLGAANRQLRARGSIARLFRRRRAGRLSAFSRRRVGGRRVFAIHGVDL